jgi:AcrR family transcriptional regulator
MRNNRKDGLLKIGERLFAQQGYRDISIREITSSAGLGMGSFYTYFPSKEAFYTEVLDAIEQRGVREIEKHVNRFRSPAIRLKALFRCTILSLRSNEILKGLYTRDKRFMYPGVEDRLGRGSPLFKRIESLLEEILRDGTSQGVFRTGLFKDPTRMLFAVFTAIPLSLQDPFALDLADDVMILVERGLKRWLRFRQREERQEARARRRKSL